MLDSLQCVKLENNKNKQTKRTLEPSSNFETNSWPKSLGKIKKKTNLRYTYLIPFRV